MAFLSAIGVVSAGLSRRALAGNPAAELPDGVASGDTTSDSTVLWAKPAVTGQVTFQYSTDPGFSGATSQSVLVNDLAVPAKTQLTSLTPDTQYYYRAIDSQGNFSTGRFKTSAPAGTKNGLRFGVSGDWRGELSPYPSVSNAPSKNLEFFHEFGDTIYADFPSPDLNIPQATTLNDYRVKHNEVYSTRYGLNTLADLRKSTSVLAVIDDHEVTDNFAGGAAPSSDSRFDNTGTYINETNLFKNGLQAFHEYNPIQHQVYGATGDPRTAGKDKLYRNNRYGDAAAVITLDARSFRDAELAPADLSNPVSFLTQTFNPARTMLGAQQKADFKADLLAAKNAGVTWKFVMIPEPIQAFGLIGAEDRMEGYAAERTELLSFIKNNKIDNVVFVTADIHGTVVNNLSYQTSPLSALVKTNAFEISTGSVAFSKPFGPTVFDIASTINPATNTSLLGDAATTAATVALYNSLTRSQKDDFVVNNLINPSIAPAGIAPFGDAVGIEPLAQSGINAQLLQGKYYSLNTYGWTQFDIDAVTQDLTVTTYGIDAYTQAELDANPGLITSRTPEIVSQFVVHPVPEPAGVGVAALGGGVAMMRRRRRR